MGTGKHCYTSVLGNVSNRVPLIPLFTVSWSLSRTLAISALFAFFCSVVLRTQPRAASMLGMSPTTEPHLQTWFSNIHILLHALLNETKLASIEPGMQSPLLFRLLRKHLPQYTVRGHMPVSLFVKLCYLMWGEKAKDPRPTKIFSYTSIFQAASVPILT